MHRVLYITSPADPVTEQVRLASSGKLDLAAVSGDSVPQSLDGFDAVLVGDEPLPTPLASTGDNVPKLVQLTRGHHRDVDAAALSDAGITITGASPVLAPHIADYCTGQISKLLDRTGFAGLKIGIIGIGRVGTVMADQCARLGATVFYSDIRTPMHGSASSFRRITMDMLLSTCDVVSLHAQWDKSASNPLIRERELRLMGAHSVLINAADARLVDNAALAGSLSRSEIGGAVLDIERPAADLFEGMSNVKLSPYTAARSAGSDAAVARFVMENITAALAGDTPAGIVETIGLPRAGDPAFWASKMYPRSAR